MLIKNVDNWEGAMAVISTILQAYIFVLLVDAILSYFPQFSKNPYRLKIKKICDYSCDPIRKRLPPHLPFDFSPLLVILLIKLVIFLW